MGMHFMNLASSEWFVSSMILRKKVVDFAKQEILLGGVWPSTLFHGLRAAIHRLNDHPLCRLSVP